MGENTLDARGVVGDINEVILKGWFVRLGVTLCWPFGCPVGGALVRPGGERDRGGGAFLALRRGGLGCLFGVELELRRWGFVGSGQGSLEPGVRELDRHGAW